MRNAVLLSLTAVVVAVTSDGPLPDGSAAAAYVDLTGDRAEFKVKRVEPTGTWS